MTARPAPQRPLPPSHNATVNAHGPLGLLLGVTLGLIPTVLVAWVVAFAIEMVGMHTVWRDQGLHHARSMVVQDLGYIAAAPTSLLVGDTVAFANQMLRWVAQPFERLGVLAFYQRTHAETSMPTQALVAGPGLAGRTLPFLERLNVLRGTSARMLAELGVLALLTAQETALRLSIAVFPIPAFLLACLLGAVDGLVRRDLRRWQGGRESSFIYHHAKAMAVLALGGGFSLYLAWPFGGFNPAYMVLGFTALVAWSLSLTLASFKKYL